MEKAPPRSCAFHGSGGSSWLREQSDAVVLVESGVSPEEFALQNRYFRPDNLMNDVDLDK